MEKLSEKATGHVEFYTEWDHQGKLTKRSPVYSGGDLIAIGRELLRDATPGALLCEAGQIFFCDMHDVPVLNYTIIDKDDDCVLAKRCSNGKS